MPVHACCCGCVTSLSTAGSSLASSYLVEFPPEPLHGSPDQAMNCSPDVRSIVLLKTDNYTVSGGTVFNQKPCLLSRGQFNEVHLLVGTINGCAYWYVDYVTWAGGFFRWRKARSSPTDTPVGTYEPFNGTTGGNVTVS